MSKVTDEILDHDYDGIREYNNPLPRWWLYGFYLTIVIAFVYLPYYHFGPGQLPHEAYEEDMAAWEKAHPAVELASKEELEKMAKDGAMLKKGEELFAARCLACHAADGGGLVGPNLTDDFSIHGQGLDKMVKVVYEGVPAKGMIAWKTQLKLDEIYAVTLFAHSLRGKKAAKPKAAEGDPIKD